MTPHKIMVVDDNSATRRMVRNALARHGHHVIEAADGKTARDLMRSECPHLVLQDLMLPDADGFRLVGELRDIAQSAVSILAFTGFVSKLNEAHVSALGFDDVISKPIAPSRLVPLIEAHLPAVSTVAKVGSGRHNAFSAARTDGGLANRCSLLASELTVLTGIAEMVLRQRDVDSALDEAMVSCFDARGIAYGALYTLEGPALRFRELGSPSGTRAPVSTFFGREDIVRSVIASDQAVYLPSPDIADSQAVLDDAAGQAILVVPLPSAAGPLGALMMVSRNRDLEEDDWRVFSLGVAIQISHVLTLAKAYQDLEAVEAKAARQAALLEAIVDNAPDYVTHVDRGGVIRFVNRAAPPDVAKDLVGQSWFARVTPEQRELARRTFDTVLATGKSAELELKFPGTDGWAWFQLRIGAVRDDSVVSGCVIVARDVTENKRNEVQLMVADRMASVGTLAAGVSYEINNPLAAVIANLDIAEQDLATLRAERSVPTDLVDSIRDARLSADRVRDIVRDLKVFARTGEDVRGAVSVERLLDSTLRMAWNELRHRAKVEKRYQRVPRVDANEAQLGQVFLNLIVNAVQAIPEGNYANNYIRVATEVADDFVVVSIADTGVGMPEDVERRLFTPFFTTKPAGVGTGLGLAISYRIISDYGGTIECHTELNKGTTFRIKLPIAPANLPLVPRKVPALASPATRRGRILMIDDEDSLVQAIRRYLSPEHDVDGVTSARVAIEMLSSGTHYDAIVCDLMMPQITGMDVHAAVMKLDPAAADRIVFVTGGAFTESARAFLDRAPNVRIEKPFDLKSLRNLINDLVR